MPDPIGPVEWVAIDFPGRRINPEVVPALTELVDSGVVRILDLLLISKDPDGAVTWTELDTLEADLAASFDELDGDVLGLLNEEDVTVAADELIIDSTALVIVWENRWAAKFATAVRESGGLLLTHDRIPHDDVVSALAAADEGGTA